MSEFTKYAKLTSPFVESIFNSPGDINPSRRISSVRLAEYLNVDVDQIYTLAGSIQPVSISQDQAAYCAYVRNTLHLNRREASLIFGLGKSAFGSIELGLREPSTTLLMLLHVLDNHPKLIRELKALAHQLGVLSPNRRNLSTCQNIGDGKPAWHCFRTHQQADSIFRTTF